VLPTATPASGLIVLIDRYPNAVLTWVDPATAAVQSQLSVATGFASNPQDYLEVSATKAYVPRFATNPTPGTEPYDAGDDVLVIDPSQPAVVGRVALATASDGVYLPRAFRLAAVGDVAWVVLQRLDADFSQAGDGRIVGIATGGDTIRFTLDLAQAANCGAPVLSPSRSTAVVACSGFLGDADPLARSTVLVLDPSSNPPTIVRRVDAAQSLGAALNSMVAFADEQHLIGSTPGDGAGRNDFAFTLDLTSGTATQLADAGGAWVLGDVRCMPGCGDLCVMADAHAKALRVWHTQAGAMSALTSWPVDPTIGLPPRYIGGL
jgi:hypothetical protein